MNNITRKLLIASNTYFKYFSTESNAKIKDLVTKSKVVLFMKGVPEQPRCGFSNAVVQILRMHGVKYEAHDVLQDDSLRQGIKEFSNWPTIPQLYINGEFIGGCDILLNMHQSGELIETLEKVGIDSVLKQPSEEKK
ncbi:glutaredoxin-related protein 5, mitochondrial [Coccinella septempunctata]|uniref:glutaredoxin-related protein 5, mitochondrial n=1 Tax=Coccinella septempunctata TaxID=41139 RepID=UPI001D07A908|nr:glutaredoxin-related protein 5, mitochondrial [Coccinella septempunctata]